MSAPKEIRELVGRFECNLQEYKSGKYNETQIRREFIDPFFAALGWDVNNKQGLAEAYKDVIHEDSIKVGAGTKAPDYCFRVGGTRKFFVEAKKPSINLKEDISPAFQVRRYAWSAKLPLSILCDFEELSVYDCRVKPIKTDKASNARILYFTYKDYLDKWDEIAAIFSKAAVLQGSFDKFIGAGRKNKGTAEVDKAFLLEIESWRELLAKDLAANNSKLGQRELNFAVQRIIDRIIFLRICEDRGIEEYGRLMALLNGTRVYARLGEIFTRADEKYNSGLFHFKAEKDIVEAPDELTLKLKIQDKTLKQIIKNLYYPDSPYEFSVFSADILGRVYEQFLGKVIRLTAGHRAVVEEKPEVRKAGGIYYTPVYIVDYIVKNTVGKLVEGKTPKQAAGLKILDPACGSGSFLIGAYQYLLDWHRDWYVKAGAKKRLYRDIHGEWKLTTAEKKQILLNNIFGVDIDNQAVEVTKLSLLLKVLEGETEQTINSTLRLFHERALPDLASNIKCGNSLIGPDFYDNRQGSLFDENERLRVNAFDWNREFSEIMNNGGFDAVIGNPPYVQILESENHNDLSYFQSHYESANAFKKNMFPLFIEKSFDVLRKNNGKLSMIIPDRFFFTTSYVPCRESILKRSSIEHILEILSGVFEDAIVGNAVFVASTPRQNKYDIIIKHLFENKEVVINKVSISSVLQDKEVVINLLISEKAKALLDKCQKISKPLKELFSPHVGIMIKDNKSLFKEKRTSSSQEPILKGRQIERYNIIGTSYFDLAKADIFGGTKDPCKHHIAPKILMRKTGNRLIACLDAKGVFSEQSVYFMSPITKMNPLYFLAIINGKLLSYIFSNCFITNPLAYPYIQHYDLEKLPLYVPDLNNAVEKDRYNKLIELANETTLLIRQLTKQTPPYEKELLLRQIDATDKQIDQLVYQLYGLTDEEIGVVEGEKG